MILLQNPNIPSPTDPVEIDRAIQDLQMKLANALVWLTQYYPRAYPQIESTQKAKGNFVFPAVYLGKSNNDYKYLNAAPDNDKTAQCFFLVDTETVQDFVRGEHNILSYNLAIVFTANLKLVNDTLLGTEIFQANLIQQVREVLTREITLTSYDLVINDVNLLFKDVYREFQLSNAAVLEKAPFTHFRFNCTITLQEECDTPILNRCDAIKNHIQDSDLDCVQTLYDYSIQARLDGLSPEQVTDLQAAFCVPCPPLPVTCPEILAFIAPVRGTCVIPSLNFATGFDDDFNALDVTQIDDLETRICTPIPVLPRYSTTFDGLNESVAAPYNALHELERTDPFTIDVWVKITSYTLGAIVGKFDYQGTRRGWVIWTINSGSVVFELASNESTGNTVTTITVAKIPLNTWTRVTVTYTGNSNASGVLMYLNKVSTPYTIFQNALTGTTVDATNIIQVGGDAPAYFAGRIYEARVWKNRVLTPAEITALPTVTDTPIYESDLIYWNKLGQGSIFGETVRVYPDYTNIVSGFQSRNAEQGDLSTDIPT